MPGPKYNWKAIFKKKRLLMTQGKDFDCKPHGMASQIRNKASELDRKVSIYIKGNQLEVTIDP